MQNESFEIKKKQQLDHLIKQTLSFNPPIWARVREENFVRKNLIMFLVSTGSMRVPWLLQELSKWCLLFPGYCKGISARGSLLQVSAPANLRLISLRWSLVAICFTTVESSSSHMGVNNNLLKRSIVEAFF
jgi:hypothetical protein